MCLSGVSPLANLGGSAPGAPARSGQGDGLAGSDERVLVGEHADEGGDAADGTEGGGGGAADGQRQDGQHRRGDEADQHPAEPELVGVAAPGHGLDRQLETLAVGAQYAPLDKNVYGLFRIRDNAYGAPGTRVLQRFGQTRRDEVCLRLAYFRVDEAGDVAASYMYLAFLYAGGKRETCEECAAAYDELPEYLDFDLAEEYALRSLDEGAGAIAFDTSAGGHHATLLPPAGLGPQWTAGQSGTSLLFDEVDDHLRIGDIALYRTPLDTLVVHRLCLRLQHSDGPLRTAGDAQPRSLEHVANDDILGRAVQLERNGRIIRLNARLPAIAAAARIILLLAGRRLFRLLVSPFRQ